MVLEGWARNVGEAPVRKGNAMFRNVVVGVDELCSWHDALALAKQLSADDAQLTVAHITRFRRDIRVARGYSSELDAEQRARASRVLDAEERAGASRLLEAARSKAGPSAKARWG